MGKLLASGGRHHHELQVRTLDAAGEHAQLDAELVPKVRDDVHDHVGLGGRGQAQHRRNRVLPRLLADEASHVAVIGPEVVPPLRNAVGLVQHPGADLALVEHPAQRPVAELFRRDDENARIAEPHPVKGVGPLGERQQPVDRDACDDAARLQPRHLICHERDQGRDHHREGAGLVVARQRRNLVAQRLAGAGGENTEDVLPGHRRLDDGPLHGFARIPVRRFRTEVLEAEPAGELLARMVPVPAPARTRDRRRRCRAGFEPAAPPPGTGGGPTAASPSCLRTPTAMPARTRAPSHGDRARARIWRLWVWQAIPASRAPIASRACAADGRSALRTLEKTVSKPALVPSPVVSQCQAAIRSGASCATRARACRWSSKRSNAHRASCSGSFTRPRLSRPS